MPRKALRDTPNGGGDLQADVYMDPHGLSHDLTNPNLRLDVCPYRTPNES